MKKRSLLFFLVLAAFVAKSPSESLKKNLALSSVFNGGDNGVIFGPVISGRSANMTLRTSTPGHVDAWGDFNSDGEWSEAEHVIANQAVAGGTNYLSFAVPADLPGGYIFIRVQLRSSSNAGPNETVENVQVTNGRVYLRPSPQWQPQLNMGRTGQNLFITWQAAAAVLQQAGSINGPWISLPTATSPHAAAGNDQNHFYRLRLPAAQTTFDWSVRQADLIFDGVVTRIDYRSSTVDQAHPQSLPYTFVTFRVEQIFKGRVEGQTFTLRFLGGPTSDAKKILELSESTLFDVGERSILLVRRNGQSATPLVQGPKGRFRVLDQMMVSEDGRDVLWTSDALVAFGEYHPHSEVISNVVGNVTLRQVPSQTESEAELAAVPFETQHMSREGFAAFLLQLVQLVHTPDELTSLPAAVSADRDSPFFVNVGRPAVPKPSVKSSVSMTAGAPAKTLEQQRYEANGRNPVLP